MQLTVLSQVQSIGEKKSVVDTRVSGNAAPNGLNSTVACGTTGTLEQKLAELLVKTLGP